MPQSKLFCAVDAVQGACLQIEQDASCLEPTEAAVEENQGLKQFFLEVSRGFIKVPQQKYFQGAFYALCHCVITCTPDGLPFIADDVAKLCCEDIRISSGEKKFDEGVLDLRSNVGISHFMDMWRNQCPGDDRTQQCFYAAMLSFYCLLRYAADKFRLKISQRARSEFESREYDANQRRMSGGDQF